jgi:hypothetical protein
MVSAVGGVSQAHAAPPPPPPPSAPPAAERGPGPATKLTLSSAALAALHAGDVDHDGDSH